MYIEEFQIFLFGSWVPTLTRQSFQFASYCKWTWSTASWAFRKGCHFWWGRSFKEQILHWILFPHVSLLFLGSRCVFFSKNSLLQLQASCFLERFSFFAGFPSESIRQDLQMLSSFASRSSALLQGVPWPWPANLCPNIVWVWHQGKSSKNRTKNI